MKKRSTPKKKSAGEEAVRYLSNRMRTVAEMRKHLREKEYETEETEPVIAELIKFRYLDDYQYAMTYFEYAFGKKRGAARIKKELSERGVAYEDIDNAYEDYKEEHVVDEYETALKIARSVTDEREITEKLKAKVARKLEQLGYSTSDIYRILGEMNSWKDLEER